jgi:hypothetical protein
MKAFGYKDVKMFFIPLFGAAVSGKSRESSGTKKALIALAGPFPGLILGLGLTILSAMVTLDVLQRIALYFIIINGFNLLPLWPFDGGKFFHYIILARYPRADAIITGMAGIILLIMGYVQNNWILSILAISILISIRRSYKISQIAQSLQPRLFTENSAPISEASEESLGLLVKEIRYEYPDMAPENIAQIIQEIWEKIQTRLPTTKISIGLLSLYLIGFGFPAGFIAIKTANTMINYQIDYKTLSDGTKRQMEARYEDKLSVITELDDEHYYHGESTIYQKGGKPSLIGYWKNGRPDSAWVKMDSTGNIVHKTIFKNGAFIYRNVWNGSGWDTLKLDDLSNREKEKILNMQNQQPVKANPFNEIVSFD